MDISAEIYGRQFIDIGYGFKARRGLWMQAVFMYENRAYRPKLSIGNNVAVSKNFHIACVNTIKIGDNTLIGSNVLISDHNHGQYKTYMENEKQSDPKTKPYERGLFGESIEIGENVFIGDNCVVLPGAKIGNGAVIGANSTVNSFIPDAHIAAGNPACLLKKYCREKMKWVKTGTQS